MKQESASPLLPCLLPRAMCVHSPPPRVLRADVHARVFCNAGRGPLVRASLAAADATGRRLRVYAVEKNVAAVVHIQALVVAEGWQERVTIVGQDMRRWQPPEQVGGWRRLHQRCHTHAEQSQAQ